jgi:hypothetical protein
MIALLALSAVIAAVAYACTWFMPARPRLILALAILVVPTAALIRFLLVVGDRPLPGSKEIRPGDVYPGREPEQQD